jgi:hypothetical protein
MKIIWKENPLATVIELDEHDKSLLRLRIEVADLKERIGMARFDLNPADREWHNKNIKPRSLEEAVDSALQMLYESTEERLNEQFNEYVNDLAGEHCGDCTCVACSCSKCRAEDLVGVNTTKGLGKHEGSCIAGAFWPKDGRVPTLQEAIESLRNPKFVNTWTSRREDFDQYIPRWTAESKRAAEWLVAYQREHFGLSASSQ